MNNLQNLKGFVILNDQDVTTIQGGTIVDQCSTCCDVDSKKDDSYSHDKTSVAGNVGN